MHLSSKLMHTARQTLWYLQALACCDIAAAIVEVLNWLLPASVWAVAVCMSLPSLEAAPDEYGTNAGRDFKPSCSNISKSAFLSLFLVVSSLSPSKMLLAPAMKHRACREPNSRVIPEGPLAAHTGSIMTDKTDLPAKCNEIVHCNQHDMHAVQRLHPAFQLGDTLANIIVSHTFNCLNGTLPSTLSMLNISKTQCNNT